MIVNSLGLGLALLCGTVILAAVSPKHQSLQTKFMYSDAKCFSSKRNGNCFSPSIIILSFIVDVNLVQMLFG
ncbi:hypothetical protein I3760_12G131500 [Carya illinoinensis]|nr:hypothetical protein I3760_12G131500 [Carya illinoinensis]